MFPESGVTEIYCMADDFCKEFAVQQEKYLVEDNSLPHRNKPNRMSDAEIMVILILFHSGGALLQTLLSGICLQTSDTPISPESFV